MRKIVIVLPTYNEKDYIEQLIHKIFLQEKKLNQWELNVLVVDSHSPDKTGEAVKKMQKIYSHLYLLETAKEGLGKAYLKGFQYAIEKIKPYLLMEMDADGQHDPEKIPDFIRAVEKGADFVIGTRYSKGGSIPKNWGLHRKILSITANYIIRLGFMKPQITEWTNGYRAIKTWIIKNAFEHIKNYSGYVFQIATMDFAIKNDAKVVEIPVQFEERKAGVSKINSFQYISQILLYILMHSSFIKFVIVGMIGFIIDFSISYLGIDYLHKPVWLVTLLSTETAIVSNFLLNNFWSFSYKKIDGGPVKYLFNFLKFNFVSAGAVAIQTIGLQIAVIIFGKNLWYLYKVLIIAFIIIPYSYILYNKVIWKNK